MVFNVSFSFSQIGHCSSDSSSKSPLSERILRERDLVGVLRQRWWNECLHRKCTVGKSKDAPQLAQRRELKTVGLLASEVNSSRFVAVELR